MGLLMDGWLVSFCSIGQGSTGQGLPFLLAGVSTRRRGKSSQSFSLPVPWVLLVDGKVCDFPRRGDAEKQKESEGATDAQASSSSGRAGTRLVSAHCGARVSLGREGVCADLEFHTTSSVGTVTNCLEL